MIASLVLYMTMQQTILKKKKKVRKRLYNSTAVSYGLGNTTWKKQLRGRALILQVACGTFLDR